MNETKELPEEAKIDKIMETSPSSLQGEENEENIDPEIINTSEKVI